MPEPKTIALEVRSVTSERATEFYITAKPVRNGAPPGPVAEQARELFAAVAEVLRGEGAGLLYERVLGTPAALATAAPIRAALYGGLDDGVAPAWLAVPEGPEGSLAGVQVVAVRCGVHPEVLELPTGPCGRRLDLSPRRYITLTGLTAPRAGDECAQARQLFEQAAAALQQAGGSLDDVVRTWFWLGDILAWYAPFNGVRTQFFHEQDLLNGKLRAQMPASTGIGVRPAASGALCGLDVLALAGDQSAVEYLAAAGKQRSPLEYGSAFSRAARAEMPGGPTVYVSGTAAIDATGKSLHDGDIRGQIDDTFRCVRAVLTQMGCSDADVVHAIAYSKTPAVDAYFRAYYADLAWPCIAVQADVCRPELLFEVEVTAAAGAKA